jgi:hypothetical protein
MQKAWGKKGLNLNSKIKYVEILISMEVKDTCIKSEFEFS